MNKERLINFLCEAKKATYAGGGSEELKSSRPNSHDLVCEKEELKYIDSYLGGDNFIGEEAIWEENKPIWGMNYTGRVVGEDFSGKFLKEALSHVTLEMPYRGPSRYEKEGYTYKCRIEGEFEWFVGCEKIFFNGVKVYECMFHGGSIK